MKRNIIGEGAYGCVHKPSIHCKTLPNPGFDYKKYVSKIMKTKNAEQELAEFVIIKNIDPKDEYHLGQPILCKPNLDEARVMDDIKKCKHIKSDEFQANPDNYSLLVLKFGGPDLKALCNTYLVKYLEKDKEIRTDKFWLEVHHLIKGLKFFKDNGIIHNDIKPQNILFDSTTGKMKYIDFGLMRKKKDIIDSSKNSTNFLGVFHWSYPFDCGFMNKNQYDNYKGLQLNKRISLQHTLSELIVADSTNNTINLPIKNPKAFSILFTYLNPNDSIPNAATQYAYIDSFFNGFNYMVGRNSYDTNLNYFADSIDIFGLGFTLQFMANCFKRLNALSLEDFTKLSIFFHKMYDFNPVTRVIDIDQLLTEYENVLLEIGILTRLNKSFENHKLVNKRPVPLIIMAEAKSDEKSPPQHLSAELQNFANNDPIITTVKCKEDKEFNPKSKRCVKKCPTGYLRNEKFKCYNATKKTKKIKSIKPISVKRCSEDKELNPKTNRCVKKCPMGYLRNEKFKCYNAVPKTKKVKPIKPISEKRCPEDKELNPISKRCVKKCPTGYLRNEKFKCYSPTRKSRKIT